MNKLMKRRFVDQILVMFGREAKKPEAISERAQKIHVIKRATNKERLQEAILAHEKVKGVHKWRNLRWIVLILTNLLFFVSFHFRQSRCTPSSPCTRSSVRLPGLRGKSSSPLLRY